MSRLSLLFIFSAVAVFTCHGCQRTFGTNTEPGQMPSHCRKCRTSVSSGATLNTLSSTIASPSPILSSTPMLTGNKQIKRRVSKRAKLNPMVCRLCGISFFYRRCMMRHLRENHGPVVDVDNLDQYLEVLQTTSQPELSSPSAQQSSSLEITMGSELEGQSNFNLTVSSSSTDNNSIIASNSQSSSEHNSMPVTTVTSASSFIEAAAQSLQTVEHVLLSSSQDPSHDSPDLGHLAINSASTELDIAGVKVTATVRTSEAGGTFREYKCTVCNKAFDRPYRLTRHLEIHDPNRPRIPCNYCSKSFTRKDSLESHIKSVHASVHPYTCAHETCNRAFSTRSMYLNHQKVHGESKPYHCQECQESFSLLAELKEHLKKEHSENEDSRCSECFKVCLSLEDLEQHKVYNHRFECEICGKVFARLAYLQVHVKVHDGQAKLNCRFCSEGFGSLYAYRQHMKTHPEYRRVINVFPCNTCNKVFQDPDDLYSHYQTEEHKEKATSVGGTAVGSSTALSIMEGDLSVMSDLVTHVVMNESDDIIRNIQGAHYDNHQSTLTNE